jgi:hypothetical protein
MDVSTIASALVGAQTGQLQIAIAARILQMSAKADASVLELLQSGQQSSNSLANVATGIGGNLDISA